MAGEFSTLPSTVHAGCAAVRAYWGCKTQTARRGRERAKLPLSAVNPAAVGASAPADRLYPMDRKYSSSRS
jgi:hypothetical protein